MEKDMKFFLVCFKTSVILQSYSGFPGVEFF